MINLEITHNPFIVETTFLIDGHPPQSNSPFASYTNQRLQLWIENFFEAVYNIFNGETNFKISFKGVEADCMDMNEAVNNANNAGLNVELSCEIASDPEERLENIQKLMQEAQQEPLFEEYVNQTAIQEKFAAAFDKDFDVYVVATMSSGKSTLINAMLGCDLLPALNEATTATIAKITDDDNMGQGHFVVSCENKGGELTTNHQKLNLTNKEGANQAADIMSTWNKAPDTFQINIEGKITGIEERENVRLVLSDTPGPNNSQDSEHSLTTMRHITDSDRNPLILYILNGSQLGINDDQSLLRQIADIMSKGGKQSKDRFIFVINKADVFDPEKGELVENVVERAKKYLENNGISNPLVYPVSAQLTSLLRKRELSADLLTRTERNQLLAMEDLFNEEPLMDLVQYMPLNSATKKKIDSKKYPTALYRSGLPAVEMMIDDYIEKYSLPNRVTRAHQALSQIIEQSVNAAEVQKSLDTNQQVLDEINTVIDKLLKKEEGSFGTDGYISKMKKEQRGISKHTAHSLMQEERYIDVMLTDFGHRFTGEGTRRQAEAKLDQLSQALKREYEIKIIDLEKLIERDQESLRKDLDKDYHKYITGLFEDASNLNLPILEGLKKQVVSFSLSLTEDDVQTRSKRVKTGTRQVKDSTWYKPWTWGSTRTEDIYETLDEEFISLDDLYIDRGYEIKSSFKDLFTDAANSIKSNNDEIMQSYIHFIEKEFNKKFEVLMSDMKIKVNDKEKREKAIEKAKSILKTTKKFEKKIESILIV